VLLRENSEVSELEKNPERPISRTNKINSIQKA
jgi:hypothetical protein